MELVGKHIKLRAKMREDLPLYARWLNDPSLLALIQSGVSQPITPERLRVRFEQQLQLDWPNAPTELGYVIADLQDNRGCGCIGLQQIDWKNRCGSQFFILVDRAALQNRGLALGFYAAEALALFLHFTFSELNLHRIEAETLAYNRIVLQAIEKWGFHQEGIKRESIYRGGQYVESYCYGLLQTEFYQSRHAQWMLNRLGLLQRPIPYAEINRNQQEVLCTSTG